MPQYKRQHFKLKCRGLNLRAPIDLMPEGYFPQLSNMSPRILGGLIPRSGNTHLGSGLIYSAAIHSIRRLNDPTSSTFKRLLGVGTTVCDDSAIAAIDTGYSGNPLSMVPMRPVQSPSPWMYVADGTRAQKFDVNRHHKNQGIAPPVQPASLTRTTPSTSGNGAGTAGLSGIIDEFDYATNTHGSWVAAGTSSFAGPIGGTVKFADTISAIIYDSGTTGWALIKSSVAVFGTSTSSWYGVGARTKFTNGEAQSEYATIRQVNVAIPATTIASIIYDSGATGLCSIVLTIPGTGYTGLFPDAMVELNSGGGTDEFVRVLSVATAQDGTIAFRCSTVNTHAASESVTGANSIRVFLNNNYDAGDAIGSNDLKVSTANGTGTMSLDLTGGPFNLFNIGGRSLKASDFIHLSLQVDAPASLTSLTIYLSIDSAALAPPATPNSALFFKVPTANLNTSYTEIIFPVTALQYTGTALPVYQPITQSLGRVSGLQFTIVTTATVNIRFGSWHVSGTYGPNSKGLTPYSIYYRYRDSLTGARSNPSPISRQTIDLWDEGALLTPVISPDPAVDTIDWFAIGGTVTANPVLFFSGPNSASAILYSAADSMITVNEQLEFNLFQPFPVSDLPRSGTVNVSGTYVTQVSGATFNTSWQLGSIIIINNTPYTIASVRSTTFIELQQSAGALTGVNFSVPEATISGAIPTSMWGPDPITGVVFACGFANAAGSVFWTNPNDPDTASDANVVEVCSPSESLIAGFMYNGLSYCHSSERLFQGYYNTVTNPVTGVQTIQYIFQEVTIGKGLFAAFALSGQTSQPKSSFWFVSRTGIWEYPSLKSITDDDLYPLFPHERQVGTTTNGYAPVDFTQPTFIRLFVTDGSLYFLFKDTNAVLQSFRYRFDVGGWWPATYANFSPRVVYQEEGQSITSILASSQAGTLFQLGLGANDDGTNFTFSFTPPVLDSGDPRAEKLWIDSILDSDPQNVTLTLTPQLDWLQTSFTPTTLTGQTGRQQTNINLIQTALSLFRNFTLKVSGLSTGVPIFYAFEGNALLQPFLAVNYTTQYQTHGFTKYGHLRDGWITYLSTTTVTLTIIAELVGGLPANATYQTYTVQLPATSGVFSKQYISIGNSSSGGGPLKGWAFFYSATSTSPFILFTDECIVRIKEWGSDGAYLALKPWAGQTVTTT